MQETVVLTQHMIMVLSILGFAVFLFVSEIVRIDIAAIVIMVALGILASIPGNEAILDVQDLFVGFSSNAVMSIIAVMIIGAGLDKTGIMSKVASYILKVGGKRESRIVILVSGTVGVISSFMQNVGAAALFIPVVSRISARTELPLSRLLMPMGFCAILGGTVTMVGSSPLILLNDLIGNYNSTLSSSEKIEAFHLFDVTPIGITLLLIGVLYFIVAGRWVLPKGKAKNGTTGVSTAEYFSRVYHLDVQLFELDIPANSPLAGKRIIDVLVERNIRIIADRIENTSRISPVTRDEIKGSSSIAVIATEEEVKAFADEYNLQLQPGLRKFQELLSSTNGGMCEVVIPPGSNAIEKSFYDLRIRANYGLSPVIVFRAGQNLIRDEEIHLQAGDTIVAYTTWEDLVHLESNSDFVVVTTEYPKEELRPRKTGFALFFFMVAIVLILFTDMRLSLALLIGAIGMILSRVLSIDEAYRSVSWSTVFLLASLIPLGLAVQSTGTASWIAAHTLQFLGDVHLYALQATIAALATVFTLVMSNVGATVLLVPMAMSIASAAGADPSQFALIVALSTSNSFLIPTHQVNALIMGPGGYSVIDFVKAGSIMTILFLFTIIVTINLFF